jgi:hypothetical protein
VPKKQFFASIERKKEGEPAFLVFIGFYFLCGISGICGFYPDISRIIFILGGLWPAGCWLLVVAQLHPQGERRNQHSASAVRCVALQLQLQWAAAAAFLCLYLYLYLRYFIIFCFICFFCSFLFPFVLLSACSSVARCSVARCSLLSRGHSARLDRRVRCAMRSDARCAGSAGCL